MSVVLGPTVTWHYMKQKKKGKNKNPSYHIADYYFFKIQLIFSLIDTF